MSGGEDLFQDLREEAAQAERRTALENTANGWKDFSPWHKPRKQWVREEQWLVQLRRLLNNRAPGQGDAVSYAGLPGREFLDLRGFAAECAQRNLRFRYLGIGVPASGRHGLIAKASHQQLAGLDTVLTESCVSRDDRFEALAREKSVLHNTVRGHAPFDLVNLDLCGNAAADPPATGSFYDALRVLLEIQNQHQGRPWLLLMTTRADRYLTNSDAGERLAEGVRLNCKNDDFDAAFRNLFGDEVAEQGQSFEGWSQVDAGVFPSVFVAGLSKWLIRLLASASPSRVVELKSFACYRVRDRDDEPDMVSLVYRIVPRSPKISDPSGLASPVEPDEAEPAIATRMLKRISKKKDVDEVLDDPEVLASYRKNATAAIRDAGGDADAYCKWALAQAGA